jgi:acyl-CoA reductase-like NAD-dependent aldehyde dehydrogenase
MDGAPVIRDRAVAAREAGAALSAASLTERAAWLAQSAEELERQVYDARDALAASTGLSGPMVEWAARTTLATIRRDALLALANEAFGTRAGARKPIDMLSVILAGNVFTASVRAIFVPLLFGVAVLAKASSREAAFPGMIRSALRRTDARLGAAMDLVSFTGGDADREAALVEHAEAVAVYGSDETIAAISSRVGQGALIAHGHGVSVAYCGADAQLDQNIASTSSSLSLDICAYDQRG